MIHQPMDLKWIIKNWEREREREREIIFSRENVRKNNKFIENKMRRKIVKIENIVIYTKLSKLCYVIYNIIFLYTIFIMQ